MYPPRLNETAAAEGPRESRHDSRPLGSALEFIERTDDRPQPISIARCRELVGDEAESITDQEIALVRRQAETMAYVVVEMYLESRTISE